MAVVHGDAAGDAIAKRTNWTREFGPTWREFAPSSAIVKLAEQAAREWIAMAEELGEKRM